MSAWKRSLKALYDMGPGQHLPNRFDLPDLGLSTVQQGLYLNLAKGYVAKHVPKGGYKRGHKYSITKLGLDVVEGRVEERSLGPSLGPSKGIVVRSPCRPAATWLSSLPYRNEIKLQP